MLGGDLIAWEATYMLRHVATERLANGDEWELGIGYSSSASGDVRGYRVLLRKAGAGGEWEENPIPGVGYNDTPEETARKLGAHLAGVECDGNTAQILDDDARGEYHRVANERAEEQRSRIERRATDERAAEKELERTAAIAEKFGRTKFKTSTIKVTMKENDPADVRALTIGGLAVHRVLVSTFDREQNRNVHAAIGEDYTVTHVASGMNLGLLFPSQSAAKLAAARLAAEGDWTRPAGEIVKDRGMAAKIRQMKFGGVYVMLGRGDEVERFASVR